MPDPRINDNTIAECDSCGFRYNAIEDPVCPECGATNAPTIMERRQLEPRLPTDLVPAGVGAQFWSISLGGANRSWVRARSKPEAVDMYRRYHYAQERRYGDWEADRHKIQVGNVSDGLRPGASYLTWSHREVVKRQVRADLSAA